ncbi:DUF2971 domain-containing protein [Labilibaculum euxinus]
MNPRDKEMFDSVKEFVKKIEEVLQFPIRSHGFNGSSQPGAPINFTARFPEYNRNLKGTPYLLENTKKILHFTSAEVLFSILNEGALRLYNLHNSNDPKEYEYASNVLKSIYDFQGVDEENYSNYLEKVKELSFIFSATSVDNLHNSKHWEKYGNKNKGVAIELEIVNDPAGWRLFYFSKVMYEQLGGIDALKEQWLKIQRENPNNSYGIELNQMLSFHKSKSWDVEEEIRIYTQVPQPEFRLWLKHIYRDFRTNKADKNISYFKLPLCDRDGNFITSLGDEIPYQYFPKLRISNIYFGSEFPLSGKEFFDFQDKLKNYAVKKNGICLNGMPSDKIKVLEDGIASMK